MDNAATHRARLLPYLEPHLERRMLGIKHPIHDFLFTYYAYRPAQLLTWHEPGLLASKRSLAEATLKLLRATAAREPNFGCFGLHEWAMVYRELDTRHPQPLRLGRKGTDQMVEGHRLGCSHWDAARFFTPPARPLNTLSPSRDDRAAFEQPACLHANMDLYGKVAVRLGQLIPSELIADCFELAWDIRILDMRAAPYDFTGVTLDPTGEPWTPVRIETPEGKRDYADQQRAYALRGQALRKALTAECDRLLALCR